MGHMWRVWAGKMPSVLFLLLVLLLVSRQYRREQVKEKEVESTESSAVPAGIVEKYFPAYTDITRESEVLYKVRQGEKVIGSFVVTTPIADEVTGFAGKVPVALALGDDNRIIGLSLLDNQESPGFIKRIAKKGFFDSWNGKTPEEAVDLEVEAVSGASMSSGAVKANVQKALTCHLQRESEASRTDWAGLVKDALGYAVVILALMSMFGVKFLKKYRWVLLLASVLVLGFWNGYFLSFTLLYGWLLNGIPLGGKILLPLMAFLALGVPLFLGKAYYCSYLCPFGAAQELAGKLKKKKIVLKGGVRKVLKYTRPMYFAAVVGLLLLGVALDLTMFEPLAAFMFSAAGRWVICMALVFLVLSVFFPRPWCNYFCLTGQLLEIIRKGKGDKSRKRMYAEWAVVVVFAAVVVFIVW